MISSVVDDDEDNLAIDLLANNVPAEIDFDEGGENNINPTVLIPYVQGVEEGLDECVAMCSAMRNSAYNSSRSSANNNTLPHSESFYQQFISCVTIHSFYQQFTPNHF